MFRIHFETVKTGSETELTKFRQQAVDMQSLAGKNSITMEKGKMVSGDT